MNETVCIWFRFPAYDEHDPDEYSTTCEHDFRMFEGDPIKNEMKFCCYCGKTLLPDNVP